MKVHFLLIHLSTLVVIRMKKMYFCLQISSWIFTDCFSKKYLLTPRNSFIERALLFLDEYSIQYPFHRYTGYIFTQKYNFDKNKIFFSIGFRNTSVR